MKRDSFYRALASRTGSPAACKAFDERIWAKHGATRAILVTDLSGFTRLTRKHGIVHFLSIFQRALGVMVPAVRRNGGRTLKTAADNLMAIFPEPAQAVVAAGQMLADATVANRKRPLDTQVRICIGIGFGRVLLFDDDCFGDDVNVAYKLGEDIAEPDEILCTEAAVGRLRDTGDPTPLDGPLAVAVSGVHLAYWRAVP